MTLGKTHNIKFNYKRTIPVPDVRREQKDILLQLVEMEILYRD